MENNSLTSISIIALHDQHDLSLQLKPGLNIIYGRNGTGKTTLLHVLANLLDHDIRRFCHIRFQKIIVGTLNGTVIELVQTRNADGTWVQVSINGKLYSPVTREDKTPAELREELRTCLGGGPVYLPAFRSVLEAISQNRSHTADDPRNEEMQEIIATERERISMDGEKFRASQFVRETTRAIASKTILCREWFGPFVPVVRFPSLWEVAEELATELHQAQLIVASTDSEAFSNTFVEVLKAVLDSSDNPDPGDVQSLLSSIRMNLAELQETEAGIPKVYSQISSIVGEMTQTFSLEETIAKRILKVYEQAFSARTTVQKMAYERIRAFENSINRFLSDKKLTVRMAQQTFGLRVRRLQQVITLADGRPASLSVLSSGERHVLTLLFSATHMSTTDGILLIDEPELSLHVKWQRMILQELMHQAGTRQIIACTHAPEVAAHHRDVMIKLTPFLTQKDDVQDDNFEILDDQISIE